MRISDWSSDVCSSDLLFFCRNVLWQPPQVLAIAAKPAVAASMSAASESFALAASIASADSSNSALSVQITGSAVVSTPAGALPAWNSGPNAAGIFAAAVLIRSEEHPSELQSLMTHSYAVLCLKKKKHQHHNI